MDNLYDLLSETGTGTQRQFSQEEYKEHKRKEREDAYHLVQTQFDAVIENPKKLEQYLNLQSTFDRYSVSNVMLILAQRPNATKLKEYDGWRETGAYIQKGAKGISILEPYSYQKEDGSEGIGYNLKKVFDISQTTSIDIKRKPVLPEKQILRAVIAKAPVEVRAAEEHICSEQPARFDEAQQVIYLKRGLDAETFFKGLTQEVAKLKLGFTDRTSESDMVSLACIRYMLDREFGFQAECPALPKDMEQETLRDAFHRAKQVYSQMKNEVYLFTEKEKNQKARGDSER
ncbi:ArdC-like ssDNA-binding domain-containing protein [Anaerovoracaceae bacterium 42-11]